VTVTSALESLLSYEGNVPILQAFGLNAVLFAAANTKLRTMLTPEGFAHAMALGTGLWAALGWRGWSLCVVYLFLGQLVTKVKFQEKEDRGLAEKRGGRRGPENVWYATQQIALFFDSLLVSRSVITASRFGTACALLTHIFRFY